MTDLVTLKDPRSAAAEAFRTLRTNILFAALENPIKTLIVTSAAVAEDKSTTAANLAVALAQIGHRTLLVDADMRRPAQHTIWKLRNEAGLFSLLVQDTETIPVQSVEVPNLSIITAGSGSANPADLISSRRMESVIAQLSEQADYVLFDAPPVLAVADAGLLASRLDALLLVARAGLTQRDHLEQARVQLERARARVLGVALTNAPRTTATARY